MNQSEIEVTIEVVKKLDNEGYDVRIAKGEEYVLLDHYNYGNLARHYADGVSDITGFEIYLVQEVVSTKVVNSIAEFDGDN